MLHTAHAFSQHSYLNVSSVDTKNKCYFIDWMHLAGLRSVSGDGLPKDTKMNATANHVTKYYSIWLSLKSCRKLSEFWACNYHYPCTPEKEVICNNSNAL